MLSFTKYSIFVMHLLQMGSIAFRGTNADLKPFELAPRAPGPNVPVGPRVLEMVSVK